MQKILILTSSGGNGLIQAANAQKQRLLKENPSVQITEVNVLEKWIGALIGPFGRFIWNYGMKAGNVHALKLLGNLFSFADIIFRPLFVYFANKLLLEDFDAIIDTQPLGTSAIIKAIRRYEKLKKRRIPYFQVISDLPTKYNRLFFCTVKKLSQKDKDYLTILSIPPLLEEGETEEAFWQKNCKISKEKVVTYDLMIREAFYSYRYKTRENKPFTLSLSTSNDEENKILFSLIKEPLIIPPDNKVLTILLGSQPPKKATLLYVKSLISYAKKSPLPITAFVFCSNFTGKPCLYNDLFELIQKGLPNNLSLIPLSFQTEETIAALFFRSDLTLTRSAGQTVMELICAGKGLHFIHSEKKHPSQDKMLLGMPKWESGAARYLMQKKCCRLVNTESFLQELGVFDP